MIKPDLHIELWNAFNDINFNEPDHKYTDSLGTEYQSATGWIRQFEPETNWDEIKLKKAKKDGVTVEELTKLWDYKSNYATHLGTNCHSVMEFLWQKKNYNFDTSLNEQFPEMEEDFNFRKSRCHELYKKMKKIYIPIAQEFIVYDQPNGICGTIDMLAYNQIKNCYSIIDWKTSRKFDVSNFKGETLKAPFDHVEACNTSEYSLQLSLYKWILEKHTSIKIGEMILFQIPGKDVVMPQVFRCLDFSEQIGTLLTK